MQRLVTILNAMARNGIAWQPERSGHECLIFRTVANAASFFSPEFRMRHVTSSGIALALLLACQNAPTAPSSPDFAAGGNSQRFPFDNIIPVPCVNGGAGESVEITGTMHLVVVDQPGVFHVGENLQGATGLGLTTGVVYRAAGGNLEFTLIPNHAETFVSTFRLIGPGLAANLTVREVFHATINANGVATVTFDKATEECKQG